MSRLLTFAMVGGVGFIVDTLIFMVLFQWAGVELMMARGLAFCVAATTTWLGNRCLTFSQSTKDRAFNQWQKFMLSASISALPNYKIRTTRDADVQGVTLQHVQYLAARPRIVGKVTFGHAIRQEHRQFWSNIAIEVFNKAKF